MELIGIPFLTLNQSLNPLGGGGGGGGHSHTTVLPTRVHQYNGP